MTPASPTPDGPILWFDENSGPDPTSIAVIIGSGASLTFVQGGNAFDFLGLDLAFPINSDNGTISLTATKSGGQQVNVALSYPSTGSYITMPASGDTFNDIVSLTVAAGVDGPGFMVIDNVIVSTVPVPAAVWLFGSALVSLGWLKRKQKSMPVLA